MTNYPPSARLELTLTALGIPFSGTSYDGTTFTVSYPANATQAQITQGNNLAATWPNTVYQSRTLVDLVNALSTLTGTQQTNIVNNLFVGNPLRVLMDAGPDTAAIGVLYYITQITTLPVSSINLAKLYAAAMYVQDNPTYLISPSFDVTINVAGWGPIT